MGIFGGGGIPYNALRELESGEGGLAVGNTVTGATPGTLLEVDGSGKAASGPA